MGNRADIYNYDGILRSTLAKIKESSIDERSKADLLKFHDYLFAHGLSKSRVIKYLTHLRKVVKLLDKSFVDATKNDILSLVARARKILEMIDNYDFIMRRDHISQERA